jgi:hypothetical protein
MIKSSPKVVRFVRERDVRYGSLADIRAAVGFVCFVPTADMHPALADQYVFSTAVSGGRIASLTSSRLAPAKAETHASVTADAAEAKTSAAGAC